MNEEVSMGTRMSAGNQKYGDIYVRAVCIYIYIYIYLVELRVISKCSTIESL